MEYDYLIVGSGLFGAMFAYETLRRGKSCIVVEKRGHIGGNVYCAENEGINIHQYGPHIFHTNNKRIWDYINMFAEFNHYINCPVANYKGEIYNLPFNMNTFNKMWGVITPAQAYEKITEQRSEITSEPKNLKEQAISLVGRDIYEKLIKGYTEKQWGRSCSELPSYIIRRLPVRYSYDNNYYNDPYQGIPIGGYNKIIKKMLGNCKVLLNTDFNTEKQELKRIAKKIVYTGSLDDYFNYRYGTLEYRSLMFDTTRLEMENYQGVAVMNFTDRKTPYTRIIEHKHFEFGTQPITYITKEYPIEWEKGGERYYPISNDKNQYKYKRYQELMRHESSILFGGRLAEYRYYDMDKTIASALDLVEKEFGK